VATQPVAPDAAHRTQGQRRGALQLVDPQQAAVLQRQLALAQQPVEQARIAGDGVGLQSQPGHPDLPARVAPHRQLGRMHGELFEARRPGQEGARRQGGRDALQLQCLVTLRVDEFEVAGLQRRHPAPGAHLQPCDAHRYPQGARGCRLQIRPPAVGAGQNDEMQQQPQRQQQQPQQRQGGEQPTEQSAGPALRSVRGSDEL
jgi:hypothetical protein